MRSQPSFSVGFTADFWTVIKSQQEFWYDLAADHGVSYSKTEVGWLNGSLKSCYTSIISAFNGYVRKKDLT